MDKKDSVMARALHSLLKSDTSNTLSRCICVKSSLQFLSPLRRLSYTPSRTLVAQANASPMWRSSMGQIFQPFGLTKRVWIWRLTVFTMPRRGLYKSRRGYVRIWSWTLLSDWSFLATFISESNIEAALKINLFAVLDSTLPSSKALSKILSVDRFSIVKL